MDMTLYIVIAVVVLLVVWFIATYNGLVKRKTLVEEAFSGMDVSMKKRYDLIPNLVAAVKCYAKHETETLEQVTAMRTKAMNSANPEERVENEKQLDSCIKKLFAVAENYPELKANEQFLDLQSQLNAVESDIMQSRKYYNGSVREYNLRTKTMPSALVAKIFGFASMPFFELGSETERENVKVEF